MYNMALFPLLNLSLHYLTQFVIILQNRCSPGGNTDQDIILMSNSGTRHEGGAFTRGSIVQHLRLFPIDYFLQSVLPSAPHRQPLWVSRRIAFLHL